MCIVAVAWQLFTDMPLVILSNRDEFLQRPTLAAHQWQDLPIFAGRDQKSGGTWLGYQQSMDVAKQTVSQNKRWATVLNFREATPALMNNSSRGNLVTDFLLSDLSPMAFARKIQLTDYAGFNLLIGDDKQAVLLNNRGYPATALHAGLHVISNGAPDEEWAKCERLRMRVFQEILPLIEQCMQTRQLATKPVATDSLRDAKTWQTVALEILTDKQMASIDDLPNTGLPIHIEQALSSIFIPQADSSRIDGYGTRTHSLLTLSNDKFELIEKNL